MLMHPNTDATPPVQFISALNNTCQKLLETEAKTLDTLSENAVRGGTAL
jgi:hypothetical protein